MIKTGNCSRIFWQIPSVKRSAPGFIESNAWVEAHESADGTDEDIQWPEAQPEMEESSRGKRGSAGYQGSGGALLQKDAEIMREEEVEQLSGGISVPRSRRRADRAEQGDSALSFHAVMRDILDYRKWFEFRLEYQKTGEVKMERPTGRSLPSVAAKSHVDVCPLFSAAVAKYKGAREDAPRIISLDEAFAGVDETNIRDMFRLMVDFEFDFIINSPDLVGRL